METFFEKKWRKSLHIQKKAVPLHRFRKQSLLTKKFGKVVEWSITAVLKTAVLRGTGGSNPSLSAETETESCKVYALQDFLFLSDADNFSEYRFIVFF